MKSIKTRLMLWLMAWITVILGSTGLYSYLHDYGIDQSDFQTQRAAVRSRLSLSLPHGIWQLDDENVRLALDSELSWPSVIAINVKGESGLNLGRTRDNNGNLRDMLPNEHPKADDVLGIPIIYQGKEHLGTATVYLSHEALRARENQHLITIIAQILLLDGMIFFIMSFNLQRFIFQPLAKLQQALNTAIRAPDASGAQITHLADDEIGGIVNGFNRIVARTAADLVKRTAAEATAREEKEKAQQAYSQLIATQETLVEAEKMASLGSLVAGVAHEINTPVGITLTAASHLGTATSHITGKLESGNVKKSDFQSYLETAQECCELILANSERAANLIHSFKQVAVDQTSEARRSFHLHDYLNEVITSLKPRFKHTKVNIDIQCEEDILLDSYPGALAQVLTNLVVNALIHGYESGEIAGVILIEAHRHDDQHVSLAISDNGKGIAAENLGRIFDPFFTTRRGSGGSGLGLNIVYNIVRQRLGGNIEVHSELGQGTRFKLEMPCIAPTVQHKENVA
ncbi:HAMP domain-containing sensor histidine kinase [Chromobacterium amazonense]|uniref:sensor histidine kinase n=1 Tax=Chromobacterium amazonense TaxID=1382803 RepID=UPI0031F62E28